MKQLQKQYLKLLFLALLIGGAWLTGASANDGNAQSGVAQGVLVDKGQGWIAVSVENKEQGARAQTVRLSPVWIGGLPKNGGGPDKRMLLIFEQLKIGDNLKFAWLRDGKNLYVTDIQVLPAQDEDGNK
jgi:hypothetical protein